MTAAHWDARYSDSTSMWGAGPNIWVADRLDSMPPGHALDLGCGEGRNAMWLAQRGWTVTAVDFSAVAVDNGRAASGALPIDWVVADVVNFQPSDPFDLVMLVYLQLPEPQLRRVLHNAASVLTVGGTLLLVAHDASNLSEGVGGPQDPAVLPTAAQVIDALPELSMEEAGTVLRQVDGADRPAIDLLVRGRRLDVAG